MKLIKLGDYIELVDKRNTDNKFGVQDVKGISTSKKFIETKANLTNVNLANYKVCLRDTFAYVADTSRRGDKIGLAFCDNEGCIVSSIYTTFRVKDSTKLLPRYLMMYFSRPEFDRFARFNSWGSARETFSWEDMCSIDMELPSLETQQKFVLIYESILNNIDCYEKSLSHLKNTCDAYLDRIYKNASFVPLSELIEQSREKNSEFRIKKLIGVGKDGFIEPKQAKDETNGHICYLVHKNNFVFAPPQIHQGSIDFYDGEEILKCSDAYCVFKVINDKIEPYFLKLILKSPFFQKYAEYNRDGVREQFSFEQLVEYKIPLPSIEEQKCVVNIFRILEKRKETLNTLKMNIQKLCPILIKGSLTE